MARFSEPDALVNAKLCLIDAQKHAKNTQEWVLITREWLALSFAIKDLEARHPMISHHHEEEE